MDFPNNFIKFFFKIFWRFQKLVLPLTIKKLTMSKKKKKKNKPSIGKDYLLGVADNIHRMNPTLEIIFNALKEVAVVYYGKGYNRRIADAKKFKDAMARRDKQAFDLIRDEIEDEISNQNKPA
jgi:hypothetical protein